MTYKQKLEAQIEFARQRMKEAQAIDRIREVDTWNGYRQGLKYALAELEGYGYPAEPLIIKDERVYTNTDQPKQCTCDHGDLRPFGECICGASKVAPV